MNQPWKLASVAAACLVAIGVGQGLAQSPPAPPPATPGALGPLGVPVGATGGVGDASDTYSKNCSSCHGSDLAGGRGPSLFSAALLAERSDAELRNTVLNGLPAGGMPAFKGQLDDGQLARLLAYLRIRSGQLATAGPAVRDPAGLVLKGKTQTVRIEVVGSGINTPWGEAFLPDGRLLVTERTGKIRIVDPKTKGVPGTVLGTPTAWVRQDGGYFDIAVAPGGGRNPWVYLSYSEVLPGYAKPLPAPGPLAQGGPRPAPRR